MEATPHEVRIELLQAVPHLRRKRVRLFFLLAWYGPGDDDLAITFVPHRPMISTTSQPLSFRPSGHTADGLLLWQGVPRRGHVRLHLYAFHARNRTRDFAELVTELLRNTQEWPVVTRLLGGQPWLHLGVGALELFSRFLARIPDRSLGFLSLDEYFEPGQEGTLYRKAFTTTQELELHWRWVWPSVLVDGARSA